MSARKVAEAKRVCAGRTRVYDVGLVATVEYSVEAEVTATGPEEAAQLAEDQLRQQPLWWIQDEGANTTITVQAVETRERT